MRFDASVMRWIDFSHKITLRMMILEEKIQNFHIFASIKNTHFPESGSRKHFHASGMRAINFSPRNYPKKSVFRRKSEKFSRWNAVLPWFSGSSLIFHASKMRAIDFSPRNYPKKSIFKRKSENFFWTSLGPPPAGLAPIFSLFSPKKNFI